METRTIQSIFTCGQVKGWIVWLVDRNFEDSGIFFTLDSRLFGNERSEYFKTVGFPENNLKIFDENCKVSE